MPRETFNEAYDEGIHPALSGPPHSLPQDAAHQMMLAAEHARLHLQFPDMSEIDVNRAVVAMALRLADMAAPVGWKPADSVVPPMTKGRNHVEGCTPDDPHHRLDPHNPYYCLNPAYCDPDDYDPTLVYGPFILWGGPGDEDGVLARGWTEG
jgi:hypothetical protein